MNTYHAFYKGRQIELQAETSYKAQLKASEIFKARKSYDSRPIMNTATKIYLALELDKAPALRRIAACIAARYWLEMHRYGEFENNRKALTRLVKRFRLGDFICAMSANYPIRKR